MRDITLAELLKAGVHFGHKSSRWSPKMKPYIYGHRNNIHIFDLEKTKDKLKDALNFARDIASKGGAVLFVGTKKQAKEAVKNAAVSCGMPYVVERWLGGTFTNFKTVQKSMKKLEKLQALKTSDEISAYTKKERLLMDREMEKLQRLFAGLMQLKTMPNAIFVFSADHDRIAVAEGVKVKIPVIGIVDSNTDPVGINYVIPGNDDSVQAVSLYASLMAEAINEGKNTAAAVPVAEEKEKEKEPQTTEAQKV